MKKSASWSDGRQVESIHKLTSGLGSFSQRILIPHWGCLKNVNIRTSSHISSEPVVRTVRPRQCCSWARSYPSTEEGCLGYPSDRSAPID